MVATRDSGTGPVMGLLERAAAAVPHRAALTGPGVTYTYTEILDRIQARAGWLLDAGVEPGVRVAACARNDPEVVVLFLACMRIGAVWVGLAPALSGTEKVARL
ncbi:MAG: AMP-binding protein, partial [Acidimicrobiales bacterium]